jgi:hypothetical protein
MVYQWFGFKTTGMVYQWFDIKTIMIVYQWSSLKITVIVFSSLASTPVVTVFFSLTSTSVATVSPSLASKLVEGFLVEPQNQGGEGFPDLDLKISSYGLVICAPKSPRRFLGLGLKPKRATVCRLCHKTNRRMRQRGRHIEI